MTDKQDRPTEYEQTHPAEMVSGYNQTPEMLAAEDAAIEQAVLRRGELDGLRKAAKAICYHCEHAITGSIKLEPAIQEGGRWAHPIVGSDFRRYCNAGRIHDLIAEMKGEPDGPG